jgi:hypothetical protein
MRKWFYAGAVAGGFLLLGAAPAQADVVPAPDGGLLSTLGGGGGALDPSGGLGLPNPLGGQLLDLDPGQNSADVTGPADGLMDDDRAREADRPTGRQPARGAGPADLPLIGGLTSGSGGGLTGGGTGSGGLTGGGLTGGGSDGRADQPGGGLGTLVPANLLGGGLLGGGLTPDGRSASAGPTRESALFDGGLPLLGGLGGLLPANESPRTLPATGDDTPTGMPAGGTPVVPADGAKGQTVDDPRLHEEPIDDEAGGKRRSFSDGGRPVAGEDEDFR